MFPIPKMRVLEVQKTEKLKIFKNLYSLYSLPWENVWGHKELDTAYKLHSGFKLISPNLVDSFTELNIEEIIDYIAVMYLDKWKKYYKTFNIQYNPNYNIDLTKETDRIYEHSQSSETCEQENSNTINDSLNRTSQLQNNDSVLNQTTNVDNMSNQQVDEDMLRISDEDIYAFNSINEPVNLNDTTNRDTNTKDQSQYQINETNNSELVENINELNELESLENTQDSNKNKDIESNVENSSSTNLIETNNGTNGKFTQQQMLSEELELWKTKLYDVVFDDLDKLLTIGIY